MSKKLIACWGCRTTCLACVVLFLLIYQAPISLAYQSGDETAKESASPLSDEQAGLAKQFADLENLLLKLSEIEAESNPVRASILQRASKLGKESSIQSRLKEAAKALEGKQFSRAIEEQEATKNSLEQLLTLLLSEDRDDRVREEKKKIEEMIKEIQRLNRLQKSLRQRTESTESPEELTEDQAGLEQKASELAQDLSKGNEDKPVSSAKEEETPAIDPDNTMPNESQDNSEQAKEDNAPNDTESSAPDKDASAKNSEGTKDTSNANTPPAEESEEPKSDSSKSEEATTDKPEEKDMPDTPAPMKSSEDEPRSSNKETETQPSSDSKPPQSTPSEGSPSESNQGQPPQDASPKEPNSESPSQEPQPSQPQTPQQRVEQARKKMEDARQKLENAEKEKAIDAQKEAEEELRKAVDELEQILRQLREEEVERTLVQLETRFRRMLEMQLEVNEETQRLERIAAEQRDRAWEQRILNVAQSERRIVGEAERALLLLREEGTSKAFPEAGEQLLADMQTVATRLDGSDVGALTQTIEAEIITGLEEILEALTAAQREMEKKKSQDGSPPPPPQPGEPQQQPLVDKLAELRLLRTLQMRILTRTTKLAELMGTKEDEVGLTEQGEMRQQIRDLGGRQQRLQQITRDIVLGRED